MKLEINSNKISRILPNNLEINNIFLNMKLKNISTNPKGSKGNYHEQLYANKVEQLEKRYKFREKHK